MCEMQAVDLPYLGHFCCELGGSESSYSFHVVEASEVGLTIVDDRRRCPFRGGSCSVLDSLQTTFASAKPFPTSKVDMSETLDEMLAYSHTMCA